MDKDKQKKDRRRNIKMLPLMTAVMIPAVILLAVLFGFQFRRYEKGLLDVCAVQQDGYVQLVVDQINLNAKQSDSEIIEKIIGTLDSSSHKYWTFSKGEQILFVKDVLETNKYRSLTADAYYSSKSASGFIKSLKKDRVIHREVTVDGGRYIASGTTFDYNGGEYRLVLLTGQSVILDNNDYLGARTTMVTLLAAVLLLLLLLPLVLTWKYSGLRKMEQEEENEITRLNGSLEKSGALLLAAGVTKREERDRPSAADVTKRKVCDKTSAADAAMNHEGTGGLDAGASGRESGGGDSDTQEGQIMIDRKKYRFYELSFYLNAGHYIIIDGKKGEKHPHTWEFTLAFALPREPFVEFGAVEKKIQGYLEKYQNRVLNEVEPFDVILPTVENITDYYSEEFAKLIAEFDGILIRVSASETPTRTYVVLCADRQD